MTGWIELEGLDNLRDLGGTPGRDGLVRPGCLWRSDNLQDLTAADVSMLRELGLTDVIDLRSWFEVDKEGPTPLTGTDWVAVHWHSLVPESQGLPDAAIPLPSDAGDLPTDPIAASYLTYITERPGAIVRSMRRIANAEGAALVHCAAGKDRTGTVIALTLSALGVDRDIVIGDYSLTTQRIGRVVARMRRAPSYRGHMDQTPDEAYHARPEVMEQVLDTVDTQWGGVDRLLAAMGWTLDDQERLVRRLIAG